MPFTFSHPAIVLPLALLPRQWLSLTGLVIGSITPASEYFLRMKVRSDYSHTINGLFWFDLPAGLLLAFLFHIFVKDSLFDNLPQILQSRLTLYKQFKWTIYFKANWPIVLVSIMIGAASHLLWDSFTHEHGYFVSALPPLAEPVNLYGVQLPTFKILQHSSTLIGSIIIAAAMYKLPADRKANHSLYIGYWIILATITFLIVAFRVLGGLDIKMYGHLIATTIAGLILSMIIAPVFVRKITGGNKV